MSRTLFVGDLHCKYHILERVIELGEGYDSVIFLGDYVDDWNAVPEASYNLLNRLIEYKKSNPKKVIALLGNHECSEWLGRPFACSGYTPLTSNLVKPLFDKYEYLFDIAYAPDKYTICSHAGFTKSWVKQTFNKNFRSAVALAKAINRAFHNRDNAESTHQKEYEEIFYHLADVGCSRGGWIEPSPLWADKKELIADRLNDITQIVGHTPVQTVTFYENPNTELYFCDTFSTYRDGIYIGDCSLLAFENSYPAKIDLDGNELNW